MSEKRKAPPHKHTCKCTGEKIRHKFAQIRRWCWFVKMKIETTKKHTQYCTLVEEKVYVSYSRRSRAVNINRITHKHSGYFFLSFFVVFNARRFIRGKRERERGGGESELFCALPFFFSLHFVVGNKLPIIWKIIWDYHTSQWSNL